MKTNFNWKSMLFLAVTALTAISFISCDKILGEDINPGETDKDFMGGLTLDVLPVDNAYITSVPLEAVYIGTENVSLTYQWKKGGVIVHSGTEPFYYPMEAGVYTVTIMAEGFNSLESDPVTVIEPPMHGFFGYWNWEGERTASRAENETLYIRYQEYQLFDNEGDYYIFNVTGWTQIVPTPAGCDDAYEISVEFDSRSGFAAAEDADLITLHLKNDGTIIVRSTLDGTAMVDQEYEKGAEPQIDPPFSINRAKRLR